MKIERRIVLAALAGLCLTAALPARADGSDADAIRHVLMATFDRPEARLVVEPVVVVGGHALAGWAQGERGGRAMLYRHAGQWQVAMCSGDGLKQASLLIEAGVAPAEADRLVSGLAAAEAKLPVAHRAKFSTFDGLVRMDASGQHPPGHGANHGHGHGHAQ